MIYTNFKSGDLLRITLKKGKTLSWTLYNSKPFLLKSNDIILLLKHKSSLFQEEFYLTFWCFELKRKLVFATDILEKVEKIA